MADLLDDLLAKPQRETAGSDTSSRFDYQKDWAFCQMLRRHMDGADYLVAFEFHDDVVFLEPNTKPAKAEFFQVKTVKSAKPRKLAALTARGDKPNSILGKMFKNFTGIWANHSVRVVLVSNVAFEFADSDLSAAALDTKFRDKIIAKLKVELPDFSEDQVNNLHFMITGISIDAMHSFLHGEAMGLFKATFGEGHGFNVHSWVRLLQSEIARKNNYPSDKIASVPELISKKCVDRKFVLDSLTLISGRTRPTFDMSMINTELKGGGWSAPDLIRLNKRIPSVVADYTDATNLEATNLVKALEQLFSSMVTPDLCEFIGEAENKLLPSLSEPYRNRFYVAAMSLVVFHEKL